MVDLLGREALVFWDIQVVGVYLVLEAGFRDDLFVSRRSILSICYVYIGILRGTKKRYGNEKVRRIV